jgi:hypothetical protein
MNCPHCKTSWIGDKIPDEIAHHYHGTHFLRQIGIDGGFMGIYDGIVAYQCPDCEEYSPRDNSKIAKEMFDKFMKSGDRE